MGRCATCKKFNYENLEKKIWNLRPLNIFDGTSCELRDLLYLYLKSSNYTGVLLLLQNGRTTTSIFLLAGNGEKMLRCLAKICVYLAKYFFYIFCNVDNVALFFVRIQWNFSNSNICVSYFFLMIVHVLCLSNVILFTFYSSRSYFSWRLSSMDKDYKANYKLFWSKNTKCYFKNSLDESTPSLVSKARI